MRNQIVEKLPTHQGFTPEKIEEAVRVISAETGFVPDPDGEVQRRTIYTPDKTWRVRLSGTYENKPALLRVENLKLEIDEESIRQKFREQAAGSNVRPPHTYATAAFDEAKGYAWSIDELMNGPILFMPTMMPAYAVDKFIPFYRELRKAVKKPFWPSESADAQAFTRTQVDKWIELAHTGGRPPTEPVLVMVERLRGRLLEGMQAHVMCFQHAHLSGSDVRIGPDGEYIVFANHFWDWRQPGYAVVFPLWGQWLALPANHRTAANVAEITDTWLTKVEAELADYILIGPVRTMLLNRLIGALLLDVPAQLHREQLGSVIALETALLAEAERLLA